MTEQHPITPPPELVEQWYQDGPGDERGLVEYAATQAARWGADQELEACCEWVSQWRCMVGGNRPEVGLRAARRPKSLKEQALAVIENLGICDHLSPDHEAILRRALEQLDD